MSQPMLTTLWGPIAAMFGRRPDRNGKRDPVAFYELRHRAAHWMYVELGIHERLVAVQLGHTDGGKLVRELGGEVLSDRGVTNERLGGGRSCGYCVTAPVNASWPFVSAPRCAG
jgi:hypothetical protein